MATGGYPKTSTQEDVPLQQPRQPLTQGVFGQNSKTQNNKVPSPDKARRLQAHVQAGGAFRQMLNQKKKSELSKSSSPTKYPSPSRKTYLTNWATISQLPAGEILGPRSQGVNASPTSLVRARGSPAHALAAQSLNLWNPQRPAVETTGSARIPVLSKDPSSLQHAGLTNWGTIAREGRKIPAEQLFRRHEVNTTSTTSLRERGSPAKAPTRVPSTARRIPSRNVTYPSDRSVRVVNSGNLKITCRPTIDNDSRHSRPHLPSRTISRRHSEPPLISFPRTPSQDSLSFSESLKTPLPHSSQQAHAGNKIAPSEHGTPSKVTFPESNEFTDEVNRLHIRPSPQNSRHGLSFEDSLEPPFSRTAHGSHLEEPFLSESLPSFQQMGIPRYTSTPTSPESHQVSQHRSLIQGGSDPTLEDSLEPHNRSLRDIPSKRSRTTSLRHSLIPEIGPLYSQHDSASLGFSRSSSENGIPSKVTFPKSSEFSDELSRLHIHPSPQKSRNSLSFEDSLEPPFSRTAHDSHLEEPFLSESLPSFQQMRRPRYTSTPTSLESHSVSQRRSLIQGGSDPTPEDSLEPNNRSPLPSRLNLRHSLIPEIGPLESQHDSASLGLLRASSRQSPLQTRSDHEFDDSMDNFHRQRSVNVSLHETRPKQLRFDFDETPETDENVLIEPVSVTQETDENVLIEPLAETQETDENELIEPVSVTQETDENVLIKPLSDDISTVDSMHSMKSSQHTLASGLLEESVLEEYPEPSFDNFNTIPLEQESFESFYSASNSKLNHNSVADTAEDSFKTALGSTFRHHSFENEPFSSVYESLSENYFDAVFEEDNVSGFYTPDTSFEQYQYQYSPANFLRPENHYSDQSSYVSFQGDAASDYGNEYVSEYFEFDGTDDSSENFLPHEQQHDFYFQESFELFPGESVSFTYPSSVSSDFSLDHSHQRSHEELPYSNDSYVSEILVYLEQVTDISSGQSSSINDEEPTREQHDDNLSLISEADPSFEQSFKHSYDESSSFEPLRSVSTDISFNDTSERSLEEPPHQDDNLILADSGPNSGISFDEPFKGRSLGQSFLHSNNESDSFQHLHSVSTDISFDDSSKRSPEEPPLQEIPIPVDAEPNSGSSFDDPFQSSHEESDNEQHDQPLVSEADPPLQYSHEESQSFEPFQSVSTDISFEDLSQRSQEALPHLHILE